MTRELAGGPSLNGNAPYTYANAVTVNGDFLIAENGDFLVLE